MGHRPDGGLVGRVRLLALGAGMDRPSERIATDTAYWTCDDCGAKWAPVTAPSNCPDCDEPGRQIDEAMTDALGFLNAEFEPWSFSGLEPVAEKLAALLRRWASRA